jgi:hypothetical protein
MLELVPCVACSRHVSIRETSCPFCGGSLPARRARFAVPRGFARAAVFSAALASCESKGNDAKPAAPTVQQGSDDLEKMLDPSGEVGSTQPRAVTPDAAVADAAAAVDAGTDAGIDAAVAPKKKVERKRKQHVDDEPVAVPDPYPREHQIPKPYGAPPARRRVV